MPAGELDWTPQDCPTPQIEWQSPDPAPTPIPTNIMWPMDLTCCPAVAGLTPPIPPAVAQLLLRAQAAASQALWDLTCRQYRVCLEEIYPCPVCPCGDTCVKGCRFAKIDLFPFFGRKVLEIDEIIVDGVAIPEVDYRLDANRYLVPHRDLALWPWPEQDINLPPGDPGTWQVRAYVGEPPPELLLLAAEDMACQLVARCLSQPCDIPDNAVSVTREGVTIRLETGLMALPTVKQALEVYGECKKRRRTGMWDPARWPVGSRASY